MDGGADAGGPEMKRLRHARNTEPSGPCLEHRARTGRVPVAVGITFDDSHEFGPRRHRPQHLHVVAYCGEVDLRPRGMTAIRDLLLRESVHICTVRLCMISGGFCNLSIKDGTEPFYS